MVKITKAGFDSAVTTATAVAAAVLPILVAAGDITANHAAAIGAGLAALVAGYHGGATVQSAVTSTSPSVLPESGDASIRAVSTDGDPSLPAQ